MSVSFDQIQRELKAMLDFDVVFLSVDDPCQEEIDGFQIRKLRRIELLALAKSIASRN